MIQKNAAYLYTGMAVTFCLLFCLYYDKRRRDDPDYKERIRGEARDVSMTFLVVIFARSHPVGSPRGFHPFSAPGKLLLYYKYYGRKAARDAVRDDMGIPEDMDERETTGYFLKEILHGEDKFFKGGMKEAVHHFTNAVVVSAEPELLMDIYERRLPPEIYSKVDARLKSAGYSF